MTACTPRPPPAPPLPPPIPLHLSPACDLVPAARLGWLIDARPREIAQIPELIPAVAEVVPEDRFARFEAGTGVDLRQVGELCIGHYDDDALLVVAHALVDPRAVARAFEARSDDPPVRALLAPNPEVLRLTGAVDGKAEAVTIFGREAIADARGKIQLGRVAEAFAEEKLHRASPALRTAAVARASAILGDAPLRVFAPGPFEGESAKGLAGLLQVTTAIGLSARSSGAGAGLVVHLVLVGAFSDDTRAAASERLVAAVHVVTESSLGRLLGVNHPIGAVVPDELPDAVGLTLTVDGAELAHGVHAALEADVAEIMRDRRPLTPRR